MRPSTRFNPSGPRLLLNHGADESHAEYLEVGERGAVFESPWQFTPMAELAMCLFWTHDRAGTHRTPVSAIVLDSRKVDYKSYETTVVFPELADEQREEVREFARLIRAEVSE